MTATIGDNSQLRTIAERIERVEAEIKDFQTGRSEIYAEAKSNGHDVKALRSAISRRKANATSAPNTRPRLTFTWPPSNPWCAHRDSDGRIDICPR
jgi:uncharacterized protein (UPF0335 family)